MLATHGNRLTLVDMTANDLSPLSQQFPLGVTPPPIAHARFGIGELVRHRLFGFRGVVFDIDPVFANSDEWYEAIPEGMRPPKDQPFYHLLAENAESSYVAYVSQQNLQADESDEPIDHPAIPGIFEDFSEGRYALRREHRH
jgi:heat shock protein HspQ